ncbi:MULTISPECIES: hypothetical protein [unclassified Microcoleus]|uniref:hypothetical protein n=1 Tax=unclassified Microcoleus TaxID=2642155 RepID=UPI002FD23B33
MNKIELEWQQLKNHELVGKMFEDELDLAYAVIDGIEARGERGDYTTNRFKFSSRSRSEHFFTYFVFFMPTYLFWS